MKTANAVMDEKQWLLEYFEGYRRSIFRPEIDDQLIRLRDGLVAAQAASRKAILAGNGGSAAIASHCAVDFTRNAGIRCINFNEASLITCLANDYGYDHWLAKALEFYADDGDVVILISSSGKSPNMVNAARYAVSRGLTVATFSGFAVDNPLRSIGRLNFWVDSRAYNVVEMTHHIWLLAVCDLIVESAEPPAKREITYAVTR